MSDEALVRVNIHDRDFQKYSVDRRIYCVPVDEREEDRLTTQHDLIYRFSGGRLFFPRIDNPRKILDCGYGGGDWVVQVAEEFEDCEVTGVDIYPILLTDQPDNLNLFGYNLNDRLNDPAVFERNAYDLVHSRFVAQGIKAGRWTAYVQDIKRLLRPNGWLQMMEYYPNIQSDNGRLSSQSALSRWWEAYASAMERSNRNPRVGHRLQQIMTEAGLRDVGGSIFHLPIGGWDPDPGRAAVGRDSVGMVGELLSSLAMWPFTVRLGWTAAQVEALADAARAEIQDASLKLYIPV
ncbi:S-adenosyl-L-methionine-dependent methyltransferase [Lentithecium fluviatile CBS 122367]|uniref:S-adenosyl-L-methionine-dependent methyltransferase n=1 Tax=Lentithecium fluviatile CBS 122367 TaxID=1168545 RepID=A0A6G1J219_9PLEO|nr:S-adenosyl-L-methionine-dependent methyltransferase [Lentithecium fluviatile CBS 122367]